MSQAPHIFVLDDDHDLGTIIKLMLEYKGYTVTLSEKAKQAEESIRDGSVDLIILDMLLSGVNGIDVCVRLKKNPATSHLAILMISAHLTAKEACLRAGADDFISKPFDMDEILSKVDKLLNQNRKFRSE